METKGEIKISPKYNKEEYLSLNLNLDSSDDNWKNAVEIIKDRITGRYIKQIDLLSEDINSNGFTIMALNCLLIETLYQFKKGIDQTPSGRNKKSYSDFLVQEFPDVFKSIIIAESFYTNIRCGILHSAQTKNESMLSEREEPPVDFVGNTLVVSVKGMSILLKKYFENYLKKLLEPNNKNLRNNFIKKMSFVCRP